uniref:c-type cytochrome n=1 Tax=Flavobacterium sp. TaxID=239 RepID=UPI004049AC69
MKKISNLIAIICLSLIYFSCTNDSASDLIEPETNDTAITYSTRIVQIMDNQCVNCHGSTNPSAGLSLHTYENVKQTVLQNDLIGRISLPQGNSLMMPQGGNRMSQNDINAVITWEATEFPE